MALQAPFQLVDMARDGRGTDAKRSRGGAKSAVFDDGAKVFIQFPSGLRQGEAPPLAGVDPAELAAWSTVTSMILNLDAAVTKE